MSIANKKINVDFKNVTQEVEKLLKKLKNVSNVDLSKFNEAIKAIQNSIGNISADDSLDKIKKGLKDLVKNVQDIVKEASSENIELTLDTKDVQNSLNGLVEIIKDLAQKMNTAFGKQDKDFKGLLNQSKELEKILELFKEISRIRNASETEESAMQEDTEAIKEASDKLKTLLEKQGLSKETAKKITELLKEQAAITEDISNKNDEANKKNKDTKKAIDDANESEELTLQTKKKIKEIQDQIKQAEINRAKIKEKSVASTYEEELNKINQINNLVKNKTSSEKESINIIAEIQQRIEVLNDIYKVSNTLQRDTNQTLIDNEKLTKEQELLQKSINKEIENSLLLKIKYSALNDKTKEELEALEKQQITIDKIQSLKESGKSATADELLVLQQTAGLLDKQFKARLKIQQSTKSKEQTPKTSKTEAKAEENKAKALEKQEKTLQKILETKTDILRLSEEKGLNSEEIQGLEKVQELTRNIQKAQDEGMVSDVSLNRVKELTKDYTTLRSITNEINTNQEQASRIAEKIRESGEITERQKDRINKILSDNKSLSGKIFDIEDKGLSVGEKNAEKMRTQLAQGKEFLLATIERIKQEEFSLRNSEQELERQKQIASQRQAIAELNKQVNESNIRQEQISDTGLADTYKEQAKELLEIQRQVQEIGQDETKRNILLAEARDIQTNLNELYKTASDERKFYNEKLIELKASTDYEVQARQTINKELERTAKLFYQMDQVKEQSDLEAEALIKASNIRDEILDKAKNEQEITAHTLNTLKLANNTLEVNIKTREMMNKAGDEAYLSAKKLNIEATEFQKTKINAANLLKDMGKQYEDLIGSTGKLIKLFGEFGITPQDVESVKEYEDIVTEIARTVRHGGTVTEQQLKTESDLRQRLVGYADEMRRAQVRTTPEVYKIRDAIRATERQQKNQLGLAMRINEQFKESIRQNFSLEKIMSRMSFVMVAKLSYKMFDGINKAFRDAIKLAVDFEERMVRIYGLLKTVSEFSEQQFSRAVISTMQQYGQTLEDTSKALYDILSAQIDSEHATKVLTASVRLAVAEFTDIKVATDAVTTVLNAYRLSAEEAGRVTDILSSIVEYGKTTLEELAPAFGNVASVAGQFDIPLQDVATSIAVMTQNGMNAKTAITSLRQLILTLANPTEKVKDIFHRYGIELDLNTVRTQGLIGVAKQLVGLREDELVTIASTRRGIMALASATNDMARYQETYNGIVNNSGAVQRRLARQMETVQMQNKQLRASFQAVAIQLGEQLLPVMNAVLANMTNVGTTIAWLTDSPVKAMLTGLTSLTIAFITLRKAAVATSVVMAKLAVFNPFIMAVAGAGTLLGLIGSLITSNRELEEQKNKANQEYLESLNNELSALREQEKAIQDIIRARDQLDSGLISEDDFQGTIKRNKEVLKEASTDVEALNEKLEETQERIGNLKDFQITIAMTGLAESIDEQEKELERELAKISNRIRGFDAGVRAAESHNIHIDANETIEVFRSVADGSLEASTAIERLKGKISAIGEEARADARLLTKEEVALINTYEETKDRLKSIASLQDSLASDKVIAKVLQERKYLEVSIRNVEELKNQKEELGENEELTKKIAEAESIRDEQLEYIGATLKETAEILGISLEHIEDANRETKNSSKNLQKRLRMLEAEVGFLEKRSKLATQYDQQIEKLKIDQKEALKTIEEQYDEGQLTTADYKKKVELTKERTRLLTEELKKERDIAVAREGLSKLLEQQKQFETQKDLGFDLDIEMPDSNDVIKSFEELTKFYKEGTKEHNELLLEKASFEDKIRLRNLDSVARYIELRGKALDKQAEEDKVRREVGLKDLKESYGEEIELISQSTEELRQMLDDEITDEAKVLIQIELDERSKYKTFQDIDSEIAAFRTKQLAESVIPISLIPDITGLQQIRAYQKQIKELRENDRDTTTEEAELELRIQEINNQKKIDGERYAISQLSDIFNSYMSMRAERIQRQYNQEIQLIQERANAEFRSQRWIEEEMRKANERRVKEERKMAKIQQKINLSQAIVNTAVAVTAVLPNLVLAKLIGALGAIQVGMIAQQKFAKGGYTGGGTRRDETGERVAGIVHEKEFVFNKKATKGNVSFLYNLQEMLTKNNGGGLVKASPKGMFASGGYAGTPVVVGGGSEAIDIRPLEKKMDKFIEAITEKDLSVEVKGQYIGDIEISRKADRGRSIRESRSL